MQSQLRTDKVSSETESVGGLIRKEVFSYQCAVEALASRFLKGRGNVGYLRARHVKSACEFVLFDCAMPGAAAVGAVHFRQVVRFILK